MAAALSAEGVAVVSGLAIGIDGAAQTGVLRCTGPSGAPPVAVVGTGLDQPCPGPLRELWDRVVAAGAVFSEVALGTPLSPGAFRAHHRIIAGLSDVVVVVESRHGDDSGHTVEAAARRSIPVCAVPGSVRSRASDGANQLLVDGCTPVRDATDVLVAVYLARAGKGQPMEPPLPDQAEPGDAGAGSTSSGRVRGSVGAAARARSGPDTTGAAEAPESVAATGP